MGLEGKLKADARRWWLEPPAAATPDVVKLTTGLLYIVNAVGGSLAATLLPAFAGARIWVYLIAIAAVGTGLMMLKFGHLAPRYFWYVNEEWGMFLILAFALLGSRHGHGSVALISPLLVYSVNTPFLYAIRDAVISLVQVFGFGTAALLYMHVPVGEIVLFEGNAIAMAFIATFVARQSDAVEEDALTWLPNRRGLERRFHTLLQMVERDGGLLAVSIFDIDHFKVINDTLGHDAGDRVLVACASAWRPALRPGSYLHRLGGDEFALLMFGMSESAAVHLVESLRQLTPDSVTISAGVAQLRAGESQADVMRRADHALYMAKDAGRNRVVGFGAASRAA